MLKHLGLAASYAAEKFGNKEALIFEGHSFTFIELNALVERTASGLVEAGVKPGDIVTLYAGNTWKWIVCYYAIARAGGVINPVNTMLTSEEIRFVIRDCKASVIVASEDKLDGAIAVLDEVKAAFSFGDELPDGIRSFDSLLHSNAAALPPRDTAPDSLSTICYTSGTTGQPKGAMQSHRAVILNGARTSQMHMRGSNDIVVSALPCPHVYSNVIMQSMMLYGCKLVLHKRFAAENMLVDIEKYRATLIDGVPTIYMYLLNHSAINTADLSSLDRAYVGGQTMPKAIMEAWSRNLEFP